MKIAFWSFVAVYTLAVIYKAYISPALRRREKRKIAKMSVSEYKRYLKYINF